MSAMPSTPRSLQLSGHTTVPRYKAIPAANDALNEAGIILEDMHEYSNRMTTYSFEIAKAEVVGLTQALTDAGFVLEGDTTNNKLETDAEGFMRATLQLTFPAEDGERHNPNPDRG